MNIIEIKQVTEKIDALDDDEDAEMEVIEKKYDEARAPLLDRLADLLGAYLPTARELAFKKAPWKNPVFKKQHVRSDGIAIEVADSDLTTDNEMLILIKWDELEEERLRREAADQSLMHVQV